METTIRKQWYRIRWVVVAFHILTWVLVFLLPLFAPGKPGQSGEWSHALFNKVHVGFFLASVAIFYLNAYYFIPFFLYKTKKWQYVLLTFLTLVVFMVFLSFLFDSGKRAHGTYIHREFFFSIIPFIFLWAMATLYRFAADKIKAERLLKEKENENLKTELLFLRSQVSPHFLFNVLNNMVALARLKSDRLEPSLIKLSGLMRYMLYESDEDKVPLSREIEYVTSYIDLQKLRFGNDILVNVQICDEEDYHLIEPMLLIPFIENAFKHGTGLIENPEIDISLRVHNGVLDFEIKNKFKNASQELKDKTSGIGLSNVRRRLNLLYDQRHTLTVKESNGWFIASLQLKLQ
ncbi:MAG: histidine kinase [Bacteroidetes bacterium]|nr:MAG: histidine kinase [Bacteroidota bacterium]